MSKKLIVGSIIVLVVVAVGSFYGGTLYSKGQNKRPTGFDNLQQFRNRAGGDIVSGSIISSNDNSVVIQLPQNAGSKIIFYSDTTQISKSISGSVNDLSVGETVSVSGTTNSDGSITAQSIQIRPPNQNRGGPSQ